MVSGMVRKSGRLGYSEKIRLAMPIVFPPSDGGSFEFAFFGGWLASDEFDCSCKSRNNEGDQR